MDNTIRYATFGQRVRATVVRGWQRGSGWSASLGNLSVHGPSQAAAVDMLAEQVVDLAGKAYDCGYVVQHEDGTLTVCQWFGFGVTQVRVKDGQVACSSSSDEWKTPKDAAEAAVRPECYGPGVVVRL